jgi:hypothetical protein
VRRQQMIDNMRTCQQEWLENIQKYNGAATVVAVGKGNNQLRNGSDNDSGGRDNCGNNDSDGYSNDNIDSSGSSGKVTVGMAVIMVARAATKAATTMPEAFD